VRMALHTGTALEREGDYLGPALNRVARLLAAAHGGQILLSRATQELVREDLPEGASLRDLGTHRLKDLQQPEHLFQLLHPSLPAELSPVRSLEAFDHNLPMQVTSFVGREEATAEVKRLLAPRDEGKGMRDEEGTGQSRPSSLIPHPSRLLTLTGAGGCGKTRLALQVAADLLEGESDGSWFVDLAPLTDPALVPQTVAAVLGVREEPGRPLTQTLVDALLPKKLLLILDNCEHLLEACAALAQALLHRCPGVQILATSRERLNVAGETTYRIPSLSSPDPSTLNSPLSALTQYEAVRLFIDRAIAVVPAFAVTNANAPAVAEVCHRLDGIPLAIELAAARVRVLSAEQIAARLDDRFRLLTGGSRASLPRQQTLRALIDWSYDLLSEAERALLRRLSVFAGGWTLEAAEAVSTGEEIEEWEVLDLLSALVDKSLVVEEPGAEPRFTMLETIREFARERLSAGSETEALRERHAGFFLALIEAEWKLSEQYGRFDRLEREHDNLRAALRWAAAQGDGEVGLRLGGGLGHFWVARGYVGEGREHLARSLALPGAEARTPVRAKALAEAGMLAMVQSDCGTASSLLEESLAIFQELGDKPGSAQTLHYLAEMARDEGRYGAARALWEESLATFRELGEKGGIAGMLHRLGAVASDQGDYGAAQAFFEESLARWRELGGHGGIAFSLWGLGRAAHARGDYKGARALLEEALAICREREDKQGIAHGLVCLGAVACDQGDYGAARALFEEGLAICTERGYQRWIANYLEGLAAVAVAQEQFERAARLLGTAEGLREATGAALPPAERAGHDRSVAAVRTALGEDAFAAAWAEGRAMPLEQAVQYALEGLAVG
jgi:predicted ATPase